MSKTISIAILVMMMALGPAYSAAPKECTDAHMKQMDAMIAKMTDAAKKKGDDGARRIKSGDEKRQYGRVHEVHEAGAHGHGALGAA